MEEMILLKTKLVFVKLYWLVQNHFNYIPSEFHMYCSSQEKYKQKKSV